MTNNEENEISRQTADAMITIIAQRLAVSGHYDAFTESTPTSVNKMMDDAIDRHAAEMKKMGQPGW